MTTSLRTVAKRGLRVHQERPKHTLGAEATPDLK